MQFKIQHGVSTLPLSVCVKYKMTSTVQNLNSKYYKASKYKSSSNFLASSMDSMYNIGHSLKSNYASFSDWITVRRKKDKRPESEILQEYLIPTEKTDKLSKSQIKKLFIGNDKRAHDNKTNYLTNNYYRPIAADEDIRTKDHSTMSDLATRNKLRQVLEEDDDHPNDTNSNDNNNRMETTHGSAIATHPTTLQQPTLPTKSTDSQMIDNAPTEISECPHVTHLNPILAKISDIYLPKNLTWETTYKYKDIDQFKLNKDIQFAVVVRIGQKKNERLMFEEGRILTSLLTSFKKVLPYIKIIPHDRNQTVASDIESPEQIILDEKFYSQYIEEPIITKNNHYICRLHFSSKKPFFWFKKNMAFQQWLNNESIRLEQNNTPEIHCPKVGFLTECHPRASLLHVYEERIKNLFPKVKLPPFYCSIEHISVRQATTKVIVIRSSDKDVLTFLNHFKTVTKINLYTFIPWREWIAMVSSKQLNVIQTQNKTLTKNRSIILSGFKDKENIKFNHSHASTEDMNYDDNEGTEKTKDFKHMTVSEFMQSKYTDGTGNRLFQFIYPVTLGVRELLVKHHHANEAIELCKVIKEDLFKYMSYAAAEEIFEDIELINQRATQHSFWEPYTTANFISESTEPATTPTTEAEKTSYKRRNDHDPVKYPKLSYINAVNNTKNFSSAPPTGPKPYPQKGNKVANFFNCVETFKTFQDQLNKMEAKQLEQDAKNLAHEKKLEKTNNNMLDEIKRTNEHNKQSILIAVDNAMEKTNVEVHNIQRQMTEIKSKNDSFASVIQYLEWKMQKDAQYNDDFLTKDEDMMIEKENYKRNAHGVLRDDYGHSQRILCEHNNKEIGGNQNNCNNHETDLFGDSCP
jgi:hypothetical protein